MQVQIDQLLIGRPSNPADAKSAGDDSLVLPHPQARAVNRDIGTYCIAPGNAPLIDAETLLDQMIRRSGAHD